jgi:hypothetical protein
MKVKKTQFVAILLSISYIVVAGAAYVRLFDDDYYSELMKHGQTTEKAVVPFYLPQPLGPTGFQRRALTPFEYPSINLVVIPIGIYLTALLLSRAWKTLLNAQRLKSQRRTLNN